MEMIFMGFMFYSRDFLSIGNLVKRSQPFLEIRMEKDFILLHSIGGKNCVLISTHFDMVPWFLEMMILESRLTIIN